ncbi:hypothetical protein HID58_043500 [Brassica napus]|uniref:BnaC01g31830D protein n=2 Tax=Brassica napus TaxID=3708 RepID=A0A078G2P0_BRANA|nr:hypothetical protein HID58_043500 [Brassica napus]CAF2077055.1 unnamed protein product [Brassica napus]CDY19297.1 BnaC01g31830D [Brassica napus]
MFTFQRKYSSSGGINAAHVHQSWNNDSGEMRTTSSTGVLQGEPVPAGSLVRVHELRRICPSGKKKQCSMHCICRGFFFSFSAEDLIIS